MELTPRDLGEYWRVAVFRYRAMGTARIQTPPERGFLGRMWAAGSDVPERVAAATLPMMADATLPLVVLPTVTLTLLALAASWLGGFRADATILFFLLAAAFIAAFAVWEPRRRFRNLHGRPLRYEEVQALKGAKPKREKIVSEEKRGKLAKAFQSVRGKNPLPQGGALEQEFLQFVQDALIVRDLPPPAETEIRHTLPALGETVALLSVWDAAANDDPASDTLARENLRRLARRASTLEVALTEQLPALRALLPALATDGPAAATAYHRFTGLLAELRSVIAETASVSEAREELEPARSAIALPQEVVARRPRFPPHPMVWLIQWSGSEKGESAESEKPNLMPLRRHRVMLFAADIPATAAFYVEHFGLTPTREIAPDWAELDAGGVLLAFHKTHAKSAPSRPQVKLQFLVPDVAAAKAEFEARGLAMGDVLPGERLRCEGVDPAGNILVLVNH